MAENEISIKNYAIILYIFFSCFILSHFGKFGFVLITDESVLLGKISVLIKFASRCYTNITSIIT